MATVTDFAVNDLVRKANSTLIRKISRLREDSDFPVIFVDGGGASLEELLNDYELFTPVVDSENPIKFKVVDKGVKVTLKSSAKFYVTVDGIDIPVVSDMLELLEELRDADGFMCRFLFENDELECALIAAGLVFKNARGSFGHTVKFDEIYDSLVSEASKAWDFEPNMYWEPTRENINNLPTPIREYIESLEAKVQ